MPTYSVKVFTAYKLVDSADVIYIKLVGKDGESDWTWFTGLRSVFSGGETTLVLTCEKSLGELLCVNLQKQWRPRPFRWQRFVEKVEVTSPEEKVFKFPIYHWIKRTKEYSFCEGKALRSWEQHDSDKYKYSRQQELDRRKVKYCWKVYREGLPDCIDADGVLSLPSEVQFSFIKAKDFVWTAALEEVTMSPTNLMNWFRGRGSWKSFDAIERALAYRNTSPVSAYVKLNWREDTFFGDQFLNGVNPMMIVRCDRLPEKFPVKDDLVTLEGNGTLSQEMKNGNMFLCDYKHLDGVTTSVFNNEKQHLTAPMVLLHKTPDDELKPVAIQLRQTPAEDNPIFVSSDSEYDWLLAKIFVRSADFNEHQLISHLLGTHLLAEVFTVALLRNLPKVHPLYKLLVPHTRFTLQINLLAREFLISENGIFASFAAANEAGMTTLMRRSHSAVTYKCLCIKEDIEQRGLESVPNFCLRDDGIKLWDIIEKYVKGVLTYYYKNDQEIKQDTELQDYIKDIFEHGFGSRESTGIPQRFETVDELVKFVTMVIFTCSAQHAAVNNGQADYGSWMPNTPTSLRKPPPTEKGTVTLETVLQTLPDRNTTQNAVSVLHLLSAQSDDFVALGQFPNEHFTEEEPCRLMEELHADLKKLDQEIDNRNDQIHPQPPYEYLKPTLMENSVSI